MNGSILDDLKNILFGNNPLSKIILINIISFVVFNILSLTPLNLTPFFALPSDILGFLLKPWTLLSYMFLHAGLFHVGFNMYVLYIFGKILIEFLGTSRFIGAYFLGGLVGGIFFLLFSQLYPTGSFLVGASAGVMAVVFAAATQLPDYRMHLFIFGSVPLKYVALGMLVLNSVLNFSVNTGGKVAHFGGALLGYLFIKQLQKGNDWSKWVMGILNGVTSLFGKKKKMKVVYKNKASSKRPKAKKATASTSYNHMTSTQKQRYTDQILDKIAKAGYDSLTDEEKEFLFKVSKSDS